MPSFDVVSEIDMQEVDNAVNQSIKEIKSRYDFKGSLAQIDWDKKEITITAEDDYKIGAMKDILQTKIHRRGVDIRALQFADPIQAGGQMLKVKCSLCVGIDKEKAKSITSAIKDSKIKVQAQVIEDRVRVTSKSIDSLQETIALLKAKNFEIPLQFTNMRA